MNKKEYVKPEIKVAEKMDFMFATLKKEAKIACRQCSSCHGCR